MKVTRMSENIDIGFNTLTLLNFTGDITIAWSPENDADVRTFVENKMKSGHSFFIIEQPGFFKRMFGGNNKRVILDDIKQIKDNRQIIMDDNDAKALLDSGMIGIVSPNKRDSGEVIFQSIRRAHGVDDVVTAKPGTHTAVMRPLRGG